MNYALVNSANLVINIIVWDGGSDWQPPVGCQAVALTGNAGIGWTYANGVFIPPATPDISQ
jgi:hypothetical protein